VITPYRLSPVHDWHERHGAQITTVRDWRRVLHYGDARNEAVAARSAIAICDVTPLSKFNIQGKNSDVVVRRVCNRAPDVGHWLLLPPSGQGHGPLRLVRLADDRFLLIGETEDCAVLRKSWQLVADATDCTHIEDLSSCFAAFLVIGPRTDELLKKLGPTDIDRVLPDACVQTSICRTTSLLIRWQGGDALGWLVLVSRDYGEYVWECILDAGHELGICPCGLEALQTIVTRGDH
jgi:glycine cleavage system aminomethyltransferase T